MAELYIFKTNFEPVLLPGEQARIITESERFDAECVAVGALPEYEHDFGALTAATWDTDQEDSNLELPEQELAQLRMRVMDYMLVRFNNLAATRQWRTAKTNFVLGQFPQTEGNDFMKEFLFKASEFFVYHDDTPRFDLYSTNAQVAARIIFSGWRFRIKKLANNIARPTKVIWVSGWPSGDQSYNI